MVLQNSLNLHPPRNPRNRVVREKMSYIHSSACLTNSAPRLYPRDACGVVPTKLTVARFLLRCTNPYDASSSGWSPGRVVTAILIRLGNPGPLSTGNHWLPGVRPDNTQPQCVRTSLPIPPPTRHASSAQRSKVGGPRTEVVTHLRVIFFSVLLISDLRSSSVNVRCVRQRANQISSARPQGASQRRTCGSSAARIVHPSITVGYP